MKFEEFAPNLVPMTPAERTERITMKLSLIKGLITMMCNGFDAVTNQEQLDAKGLMALGTLVTSLGERMKAAGADLGDTVADDMIAIEMREMFDRITEKIEAEDAGEEYYDDEEEEDDGEDFDVPESFKELLDNLEDAFGKDESTDE